MLRTPFLFTNVSKSSQDTAYDTAYDTEAQKRYIPKKTRG